MRLHARPFLNPCEGIDVRSATRTVVLFANPSKFIIRECFSPLPPPIRNSSMNTPQNTPNPVRKLRLLLRVRESEISLNVSQSSLIPLSMLQSV